MNQRDMEGIGDKGWNKGFVWNIQKFLYKKNILAPLLLTVLLLGRDIITKEIYKGKHLIGDLITVLEGESMTAIEKSMATANRHGAGVAAGRSPMTHKHQPKREKCVM